MLEISVDARLQVTAAATLLERSRLVEWHADPPMFSAVPRDIFESVLRRDVDPVFGRLICWILFSAGAEFLAKGVCLSRRVEIRTEHKVPAHPQHDIDAWVRAYRNDWRLGGTVAATHFGTLAVVTRANQKTNTDAALVRLCKAVRATVRERDRLLAAYDLLARTIRNRDAHAYVPNVRDAHYSLVPELFAGCFNLLVGWLPGGAGTLTTWRSEPQTFIASLA